MCRNFSYGRCEYGRCCVHIHYLNLHNRVNQDVLRNVFRDCDPKFDSNRATINEACLLFIEGRCKMGLRCHRVHLIPPSATINVETSSSDSLKSESENEFNLPQKNSLITPPSLQPINIVTTDDHFSTKLLDPLSEVTESIINLRSHESSDAYSKKSEEVQAPMKWDCETDACSWLDVKWDCETDAKDWLETDSDTSESSSSSSDTAVTSLSILGRDDPAADLLKWGCETDARAWLDTGTNTDASKLFSSTIRVRPPPPRHTDTCLRWLRGACERGYNCLYVHGDLEYDDSNIEPRPSVPPTYYLSTIYDHIRVKFGAGFSIQEVVTGFETPWLYLDNIPSGTPESEISQLLTKHGTLVDLLVRGSRARARFSSNIEARNANVVLNGTRHWGSIISTQLPVNTAHGRSATLRDTAVRIEWEAPCITGYAGYPTEERAQKAISIAKAAYSKTYISAHLYTGLPQMATYTVRFRNLPIDTKKGHMSKYSQPLDMMWDMPNYTSVENVANGLRHKLEINGVKVVNFEVLPPPYRDGRVRAWAHFSSPAAAKEACGVLHLRKPLCTGKTRIFAYHMQSLSYPIPLDQYKRIEGDIGTFRQRLWHDAPGTTLTITQSGGTVTARLSAIDGKDLGQLKAEFEKLRGGEVVRLNGEVLWDRFFGLPAGKVYLRQLEIAHLGLIIRDDASRRRLTLLGQSNLREAVKAILIQKHTELAAREHRSFHLGPLIGPFMHFELGELSKRLGSEKVVLDVWNRRVTVSGHAQDFRVTLQAVQRTQRRQNPRTQPDVASCPVCLGEVDCPVTLSSCKHSYCRSCLINYFQAAIDGKFFPLTCLGNDNNCSSLLPISLARQVLSLGKFDALVEAAFQTHIHERPKEFFYCPSPDCMQVYRPAPSGNVLQCPSCLLRICPQCHVEQHDGLECPERDGDRLFNDWAEAHDVKNCPECKVPIERAEGCNHVTCVRCHTHICWVCMRTFPGGDGIYSHMRAEHGGIGNLFDMDGL
ncbi:hypothetical protein BDP27DRAFT_462331 [Rhodocollybia butyracea]|uniref:RBR-type E3 ubiquitin transferase n=1 Tax=Rhodocollybia butyracea TaxID=206335 RepID=A0A9P5UAA9_9AGAR|nr:hypothetical protein BDP27DRAFT_462331 [Rhodocollybia butyracea]